MLVTQASILTDMIGKAANRFQTAYLSSTFGAVSSDPWSRNLADYIMTPNRRFRKESPPSTRKVMTKLEKIALEPGYQGKKGWWSEIDRFVRNVKDLRITDIDEGTAQTLRKAYQNEGMRVDFGNIISLLEILGKGHGRELQKLCRLFLGRQAYTPYCEEAENLKGLVRNKIQEKRLNSMGCGILARSINTLLELEAPPELLDSAHFAIRNSLDCPFHNWVPKPADILRYHKASDEEREFIRKVIETEELWKDNLTCYNLLERGVDNPRMYSFLTQQVQRGVSGAELVNLSRSLGKIEKNPQTAGLLGLALTGKRTSLNELLEHLSDYDFQFLGGPSNQYGYSVTPLPSLINLAEKDPPKKVMLYLGDAVRSGSEPTNISQIAGSFWEWEKKNNQGLRAYFTSRCYGKRFQDNKKSHQPRTLEIPHFGNTLESHVVALKSMYDNDSGLVHKVIIGRHEEDNGSCYTAAFVNDQEGVIHIVFPHPMMFDPSVSEESCHGCESLALCSGKDEYSTTVLFDPKDYDPKFLKNLERTIPGAFELHRDEKGLHFLGTFSIFPEKMSVVYYHPLITEQVTPVQTNNPLNNMVVFPSNIPGSAYLVDCLRKRKVQRPKEPWIKDERVFIQRHEWVDESCFPQIQEKMKHLRGREIRTSRDAPDCKTGYHYHPSISHFDLTWKLTRGTIGWIGTHKDPLIIQPIYRRGII